MAGESRAEGNPVLDLGEPWKDPRAKPYIHIENVTKRFGDFTAVDNVTLKIYQGELFCLLGGSGCGKTTLLRMLAGFEEPTDGRIYIDGQDMTGIPPYERPVNMMFQSYALFPHMTVEQNVAFGLKQDRTPREETKQRVADALELVQLTQWAKRKPHQLSGGQRQRVALARALIKRPKLLLLDEPLAALDKKLREQTQFELMNIQDEVGITFVVVTHDQEEAMTLATRIAVMDQGRVVQTGTPSEIYEYPRTRFVANFVGTINIFEGRVSESAADHIAVDCDDLGAPLSVGYSGDLRVGQEVGIAVRPEKIAISKEKPSQDENLAEGEVTDIGYLGTVSVYRVQLASGLKVQVMLPNLSRSTEREITWDDRVWLSWKPGSAVVLLE
jgi:putrescine transport system ATP-binding protein